MTAQSSEIAANPFAVQTPESLPAEKLVELFVPYPEFENLQVSGHQFLHGHRGSGKSMMLQMMSPISQTLWRMCQFDELPYFGVYISVKTTELNAPEYTRLEKETSGTILSEHVLTTKILSALFYTLQNTYKLASYSVDTLRSVVVQTLFTKFIYAGWKENFPDVTCEEFQNTENLLQYILGLIDEVHAYSTQYIKRKSFSISNEAYSPYEGALFGFQDVLLPIVNALSATEIIPKGPVYILIDDADNLTYQQTLILNTWVSYRTTGSISLKISTQLNYKTYNTVSGIKIEAPHDFSSINFTSVHTGSNKERYPELVSKIVTKRLTLYGSPVQNPYDFFPEDQVQAQEIRNIADEIMRNWEERIDKSGQKTGSYRARDDAYRYARPEYIRRLIQRKQGSQYRYAGFMQLVHISSGIIRYFLEPAARMFADQQLFNNSKELVTVISPAVQDEELRKQANKLLLQDLDDLSLDLDLNSDSPHANRPSQQITDAEKLRNIVLGIGALFKSHILDQTSTQRRVFSFSISDSPPKKLVKILRLGVINGYFYEDSIGAKTGMGRVKLYVLTRRLAPAFSLDPMGFSSYLTVTSEFLMQISLHPQAYINRLRTKGISNIKDDGQLPLLEGDDDA